jgi:hypothetical protein
MAIKIFNIVSITSILAVILLFTTLWNLQTRPEYFSNDEFGQLSHELNETNTTTEAFPTPTSVIIEEPEPTETRPSWREIAFKYGTDKVTTHNYQYSKYLFPVWKPPLTNPKCTKSISSLCVTAR